ncbi:MAG: hypothetical protein K2K90_18705 [Lachnospiraceae bacterium]|nr:hypothetical protein [Lachnospiraceae bacterium]
MSERVNDNLDKGKGKIDNVKKKLRKKTSYDKSTQLWKSEEISGDNTRQNNTNTGLSRKNT